MVLALKIFTWITLIVGILYTGAEILALFLPIETSTPILLYTVMLISVVLLYCITKEKKILYLSGAYILLTLLFGLSIGVVTELNTSLIVSLGITLVFGVISCFVIYKLYFLLYKITQQKLFKYAFVFSGIGIIIVALAPTLENYFPIEEYKISQYFWLIGYIMDILDTLLCSIAILKTKFKIQKGR